MRVIVSLLLLVSVLCACNGGGKITLQEKLDVYYRGKGVTEDDARRLGNFLYANGYFDTSARQSVQLDKDSTWIVRLVVKKELADPENEDMLKALRELESELQEGVFKGEKTRVALADDELNEFRIDTLKRNDSRPE